MTTDEKEIVALLTRKGPDAVARPDHGKTGCSIIPDGPTAMSKRSNVSITRKAPRVSKRPQSACREAPSSASDLGTRPRRSGVSSGGTLSPRESDQPVRRTYVATATP